MSKNSSTSNRVCAYCGNEGKMTREHIHPSFLKKINPSLGKAFGFVPSAGKVLPQTQNITIKDVCAICNNERLGELDAYAKGLCEKHFMSRTFKKDETVTFRFDYDLLLRWLLKVSFNSFRPLHGDCGPFGAYRDYILKGTPFPKDKYLQLHLQLIRDYEFSEEEQKSGKFDEFQDGFLPAQFFNTGQLIGIAKGGDARHVVIYGFRFILLFLKFGKNRWKTGGPEFQDFLNQLQGSKKLDRNLNSVSLPVSATNVFEVQFGQRDPDQIRSELDYFKTQSK